MGVMYCGGWGIKLWDYVNFSCVVFWVGLEVEVWFCSRISFGWCN